MGGQRSIPEHQLPRVKQVVANLMRSSKSLRFEALLR
jgi:hypothetical protein